MGTRNEPRTIDDLTPHPRNPRRIQDVAAKGLRKSIERFGDLSGITYNVHTGHLVCGHQRLQQLRELGYRYLNGVLTNGESDFPVRIVDWDEQFELQANVAANNEEIQGDWTRDIDAILNEIREDMRTEQFLDLGFQGLAERLRLDFTMPEVGMPNIDTGDIKFVTMSFVLSAEQKEIVDAALERAGELGGDVDDENQNRNGNRLAMVCARFV